MGTVSQDLIQQSFERSTGRIAYFKPEPTIQIKLPATHLGLDRLNNLTMNTNRREGMVWAINRPKEWPKKGHSVSRQSRNLHQTDSKSSILIQPPIIQSSRNRDKYPWPHPLELEKTFMKMLK
jgi:hypothetical protein